MSAPAETISPTTELIDAGNFPSSSVAGSDRSYLRQRGPHEYLAGKLGAITVT
jgi:hypothetical protein